jgi:hypothetical protein
MDAYRNVEIRQNVPPELIDCSHWTDIFKVFVPLLLQFNATAFPQAAESQATVGFQAKSRARTPHEQDDEVNLSSFKVDGKIYKTQDWKQQNAMAIESLCEGGHHVSWVGQGGLKKVLVNSKSTSDNEYATIAAL